MKTSKDLNNLLNTIDRKSYPAYKDTKGIYQFPDFRLSIDHVQGDPFASPSKLSIHVDGQIAGFPQDLYDCYCKRIALSDYLIRLFYNHIEKYQFKAKGSGKSGLLSVSRCGQEILERTACHINDKNGDVLIRLEVGFPANGRTIQAAELCKILFDYLPKCVENTLIYYKYSFSRRRETEALRNLAQDQEEVRRLLPDMGLVAFIANGSVLPRESSISGRPMKHAVLFQAPETMEVTLNLPNKGIIKGMGMKRGVTLIVGGGYHGKSTLLNALELGVYNHIAGDGREFVITDDSAVKLRAEDGRSIRNVDISMFINDLPNGKDTKNFCTEDASGSTSQAANVSEAIEAGTRLFLIDEDTSATNFMIRDELMQRVVTREQEPITPFIERVNGLYHQSGISTIIVAGSSGSYFHAADHIIQMDRYLPINITKLAKKEAENYPSFTNLSKELPDISFHRLPLPVPGFKTEKFKLKTGRDYIQIDHDNIDLRYVEQLADGEQLWALGYLLRFAELRLMDGKHDMREVIDTLMKEIDDKGLAAMAIRNYLPSGMALPRKYEIFACFNRYRKIMG